MRATLIYACGASALLTPLRRAPPARLARPPTALRAVPVQSEWTTWALLGTTGALGLYAEENSKLGAALSSNVVTMVAALVLANLGALPTSSPVYGTVVKKLVPLAVAALLFDADLDRVRREGRRLLAPFVVAALGTIAGTVVAWRLVPLQRGIPALAARATMASALTARHIGGAVNYVSVAEYGGAAPELVAAGIAADNAVVAPYFVGLFAASGPAAWRRRSDGGADGERLGRAQGAHLRLRLARRRLPPTTTIRLRTGILLSSVQSPTQTHERWRQRMGDQSIPVSRQRSTSFFFSSWVASTRPRLTVRASSALWAMARHSWRSRSSSTIRLSTF